MPQHRHLRRLDEVWLHREIYFITTCAASRRPILANATVADILRDEFSAAPERHGWRVGRFVIMPDHVHFFCAKGGRSGDATLSGFMRGLKQWSAKRIAKATGVAAPIWQPEFFDRLMRSDES